MWPVRKLTDQENEKELGANQVTENQTFNFAINDADFTQLVDF